MSARLQFRYIQVNTTLAISNYKISAKCLNKEHNAAHPSQTAGEGECLQTPGYLGRCLSMLNIQIY